MRRHLPRAFYLLAALLPFGIPLKVSSSEWRAIALPALPMNIVENNGTLWVCGADEWIGSSEDGGQSWKILHSAKDSGVLLTIGFANDKLGYAAGTSGSLLLTNDGGKTWGRIKGPAQVIYGVSFADEKHGLIHTPRTVYATSDGGATWLPVKIDLKDKGLKGFSYVSTVLALDPEHMTIVLSEGNAAYNHQILLLTKDGGSTWKVQDIPSTGLIQLTKHAGEYWFAGIEVIEKDKPGGGYGVPLLMHSPDGEAWSRLPRWSPKEFSVCNSQGCLYWDGAGVELPPENPVHYFTFPAKKQVTAKWAVAKDNICSVAASLKCASVSYTETIPAYLESSPNIAPRIFPPALDAAPTKGVQCIACDVEHLMVTQDYQGKAEIELKLHIAPNGLVEQAEVIHATRPEIGERIAATVRTWIFVPPKMDGIAHPAIARVKIRVQAIKGN